MRLDLDPPLHALQGEGRLDPREVGEIERTAQREVEWSLRGDAGRSAHHQLDSLPEEARQGDRHLPLLDAHAHRGGQSQLVLRDHQLHLFEDEIPGEPFDRPLPLRRARRALDRDASAEGPVPDPLLVRGQNRQQRGDLHLRDLSPDGDGQDGIPQGGRYQQQLLLPSRGRTAQGVDRDPQDSLRRGSGIDTIVDDGPLIDLQLRGVGDEGQGEGIRGGGLGGLWREAAGDDEACLPFPLDAQLPDVERLGEGGERDLAGLSLQLVGAARQIPEALALEVGLRQSNGQGGEAGDVVDKADLGDRTSCRLPQDDGLLQTERDCSLDLSGQSGQRERSHQLPRNLPSDPGRVESLPVEGLEDPGDLELGDRRR